MAEFWSSVSKWFSEKTSSPLYFTYAGFFIVWNWKFFQIIFLESEKLFSSPRVEYIEIHLVFHFFQNILWDGIINFSWHILPPALLTFLAIKYLPVIQKWAFDIHIRNHFERKSIYRKENERHEREETERLKNIAIEKEQQKTQREKIKSVQTQEDKWLDEFEEFKKNNLFFKFNQIIICLYKYAGAIKSYRSGQKRVVDTDILATANSRDLINIKNIQNEEIIEPTQKGKFFISKYLEENPI